MAPTDMLSMEMFVPKFYLRLDFIKGFLDVVGLGVLLSYDLAFLRRGLMLIPFLRRRHNLLNRVRELAMTLRAHILLQMRPALRAIWLGTSPITFGSSEARAATWPCKVKTSSRE